MDKIAILEAEYLETVNLFYAFWKQHVYDYPKHFKNYLKDGEMKERLSFNIVMRRWYLLDKQEM